MCPLVCALLLRSSITILLLGLDWLLGLCIERRSKHVVHVALGNGMRTSHNRRKRRRRQVAIAYPPGIYGVFESDMIWR